MASEAEEGDKAANEAEAGDKAANAAEEGDKAANAEEPVAGDESDSGDDEQRAPARRIEDADAERAWGGATRGWFSHIFSGCARWYPHGFRSRWNFRRSGGGAALGNEVTGRWKAPRRFLSPFRVYRLQFHARGK